MTTTEKIIKLHWDKPVVLEKTLEGPLDCKEMQPVHSKGDQSWVFIGRNDVEAETPVLWPPHGKSWLIGKDSDAGRDQDQEEKGMTEDEMAGWHHWLNWHGFGWTPGVGDGQGGLVCCSSWGGKELEMTERLNWNWTELVLSSIPLCKASFLLSAHLLARKWKEIFAYTLIFLFNSLKMTYLHYSLRICL